MLPQVMLAIDVELNARQNFDPARTVPLEEKPPRRRWLGRRKPAPALADRQAQSEPQTIPEWISRRVVVKPDAG